MRAPLRCGRLRYSACGVSTGGANLHFHSVTRRYNSDMGSTAGYVGQICFVEFKNDDAVRTDSARRAFRLEVRKVHESSISKLSNSVPGSTVFYVAEICSA